MMVRVMAVGIFDLLHAGHLHYVEQAKSLGDELIVVIAHDETVRKQKHEPVT
jgi:FAD synthetase